MLTSKVRSGDTPYCSPMIARGLGSAYAASRSVAIPPYLSRVASSTPLPAFCHSHYGTAMLAAAHRRGLTEGCANCLAGGGSDPHSGSSAQGSASSLRRQLRDAGALRMANCRCAGPKRRDRLGIIPKRALGRTASCSTRARTARHASPAAARSTTSRWTCTYTHRQPEVGAQPAVPRPQLSPRPHTAALSSDPGSPTRCQIR